jgi:hypothetical protein
VICCRPYQLARRTAQREGLCRHAQKTAKALQTPLKLRGFLFGDPRSFGVDMRYNTEEGVRAGPPVEALWVLCNLALLPLPETTGRYPAWVLRLRNK